MPLLLSAYTYMGTIVPFAVVVPLLLALQRYKHLPVALKMVAGYLLLSGATSIVVKLLAARSVNNMPVFHAYTLLEFIIISLFYRQVFAGTVLQRVILVILLVFSLFCAFNAVFIQDLFTYNSYSRFTEAIFIVIYGITYFRYVLENKLQVSQQSSLGWVNAGLLLYFSGSLSLFISGNLIMSNVSLNALIWNIHASLLLIMFFLFTIAFARAKRPS